MASDGDKKHWYDKWEWSAWRNDTNLRKCSTSTRGIWMDLLGAMFFDDRSGQITGTPEQLARIATCSMEEIRLAIEELRETGTADVVIDHSDVAKSQAIVTIINRRMRRLHREAENKRNRARRSRKRAQKPASDGAQSAQSSAQSCANVRGSVRSAADDAKEAGETTCEQGGETRAPSVRRGAPYSNKQEVTSNYSVSSDDDDAASAPSEDPLAWSRRHRRLSNDEITEGIDQPPGDVGAPAPLGAPRGSFERLWELWPEKFRKRWSVASNAFLEAVRTLHEQGKSEPANWLERRALEYLRSPLGSSRTLALDRWLQEGVYLEPDAAWEFTGERLPPDREAILDKLLEGGSQG